MHGHIFIYEIIPNKYVIKRTNKTERQQQQEEADNNIGRVCKHEHEESQFETQSKYKCIE